MRCPLCKHYGDKVIDSRPTQNGTRRRRECSNCDHRFTTYERTAEEEAEELRLSTPSPHDQPALVRALYEQARVLQLQMSKANVLIDMLVQAALGSDDKNEETKDQ